MKYNGSSVHCPIAIADFPLNCTLLHSACAGLRLERKRWDSESMKLCLPLMYMVSSFNITADAGVRLTDWSVIGRRPVERPNAGVRLTD